MKTLLKLMILAAVMTAWAPRAGAAGTAEPPAGLAAETWRLTYDNYRYLVYGSSRPEYHGVTRDVTVVRDGGDIYIKGVFKEYPDAWIKGDVSGNVVNIGKIQPLGDDAYFKSGSLECNFCFGHTFNYNQAAFDVEPAAVFTMSEDGATIMAVPSNPERYTDAYTGFWYAGNGLGFDTYYDGKVDEGPGGPKYESFPDTDFMINMCFKRTDAGSGTPEEGNHGAPAYAPAVPPAGAPAETWTLVCDGYRYLAYGEPMYEYHNLSREVTVARDGGDIYVKGVFEEYPDAWIKGTAEGGVLNVPDAQPMEDSEGGTAYFRWGSAAYRSANGDFFSYHNARFTPVSDASGAPRFVISGDGGTIALAHEGAGATGAVWYTDAPDAELSYYEGAVSGRQLPGFTDSGYMINLCLKKNTSGVEDMAAEDPVRQEPPMYDMQGRAVNPETAAPGIYIKGGKKMIIR